MTHNLPKETSLDSDDATSEKVPTCSDYLEEDYDKCIDQVLILSKKFDSCIILGKKSFVKQSSFCKIVIVLLF